MNASEFGFSSLASGVDNAVALQRAVDQGGTIRVEQPGTYDLAATVYVGSDTCLHFGRGVVLRKVDEREPFTHVLLNKGALTKTADERISVEGLHLSVNGVDKAMTEVYGLRGQIAFLHVRDLRIKGFKCTDLGSKQFAIHVCAFEDLLIDDVIVEGAKDGVHLGHGKRFAIRNGVFRTRDDAIALNAHDYSTSNPELGWIENGVIENCYDLPDGEPSIGFFCRLLAGAWTDWRAGMKLQHSDTVVSEGRLYRVQEQPDGTEYVSNIPPTHASGREDVDGIHWGMIQDGPVYTAGVRNVVFRDIVLEKPRVGFSVHFDNGRYNRSYYPGAPIPMQERIVLENVQVQHEGSCRLINIGTPIDTIHLAHCRLGEGGIRLHHDAALGTRTTHVTLVGCEFCHAGPMTLVTHEADGKEVILQSTASVVTHDGFSATVESTSGVAHIHSDLPGIKEQTEQSDSSSNA